MGDDASTDSTGTQPEASVTSWLQINLSELEINNILLCSGQPATASTTYHVLPEQQQSHLVRSHDSLLQNLPLHQMSSEQQKTPIGSFKCDRPANQVTHGSGQAGVNCVRPTLSPSQLAARQVIDSELPLFSGNPLDWPIFHSAFQTSSEACGFSDVENLTRLQRCLLGLALESVRSRLLLPTFVPRSWTEIGRPLLLDQVRNNCSESC